MELIDHPEGGRFREVFRSIRRVSRADGEGRAALTHILFALEPGEASRFHRVDADEVWNLYRGGLRLLVWEGGAAPVRATMLSAAEECFCHVVPAGHWQAAEPLDGPVLVGCSVGPGFEFADFELVDPASETARRLLASDPGLRRFVDRPAKTGG